MIVNSLIDSIWKEKTQPETIKDTIQTAFCEIYRGGFDEIKELDEEQLYNSYLNSGLNTDRLLAETNWNSYQMNVKSKKPAPISFNTYARLDEEKTELWASDIYEKDCNQSQSRDQSPIFHYQTKKQLKCSTESKNNSETINNPRIKKDSSKKKTPRVLDDSRSNERKIDQFGTKADELLNEMNKRRSLTKSSRTFTIDENNLNSAVELEMLNRTRHNQSNQIQSEVFVDNFSRTSDFNMFERFKNLPPSGSFNQRKMATLRNQQYSSSRDLHRNSFIPNKELNPSRPTQPLKREDRVKSPKIDIADFHTPKTNKKTNFDISLSSTQKTHTRNKSYTSLKDRFLLIDCGFPKNETPTGSFKRMDKEYGNDISYRRDFSNKQRK